MTTTCTNYNAAINYNAPINYNGVCDSPVPQVLAGGYYRHDYQLEKPKKKRNNDDDIALMIAMLELED